MAKQIYAQILLRNREKLFSVLPRDEFDKLEELFEDADDLILLGESREEQGNQPCLTLDEVKKKFGIE